MLMCHIFTASYLLSLVSVLVDKLISSSSCVVVLVHCVGGRKNLAGLKAGGKQHEQTGRVCFAVRSCHAGMWVGYF